jgi:Zn-dependent M28 family amino/carboxypeptidase
VAQTDLRGAIVLLLPGERSSQQPASLKAAVEAAGAAAIIQVLPESASWESVRDAVGQGRDQLQSEQGPAITGWMPLAAARSLIDEAGLAAAGTATAPVRTAVTGTLEVSTQVNAYISHNVIGRLRGSGKGGESVIYLGHWDHLGICAPEDAADRICNGAVDNASGIAVLIEVARNLARGKRPERDILFLGTTAEEVGLLGAEYFASKPTVPARSIVAAINVDTVAIHRRGEPVAIIGRGVAALDGLIARTAAELGRKMDTDTEADAFVQRQDGWAFTRAGIPSVMVGGSFSDMKQLGAFLSGPYHKVGDDLNRELILDGAAEDADLLIALGRKLANPKLYQPPRR